MVEGLFTILPIIVVLSMFIGKLIRQHSKILELEGNLAEEKSRYSYKLQEFNMEMELMRNELHSIKSGVPKLVTSPSGAKIPAGKTMTVSSGSFISTGMMLPSIDPIMMVSLDDTLTVTPPVDTTVVDWLEKK